MPPRESGLNFELALRSIGDDVQDPRPIGQLIPLRLRLGAAPPEWLKKPTHEAYRLLALDDRLHVCLDPLGCGDL